MVKNLRDLFGEDINAILAKEPEHSLQVLLEHQERYGISSDDFFAFYYKHGAAPVKISPRELARWKHHYEIFKMASRDAP
jgi:hypothetical protein